MGDILLNLGWEVAMEHILLSSRAWGVAMEHTLPSLDKPLAAILRLEVMPLLEHLDMARCPHNGLHTGEPHLRELIPQAPAVLLGLLLGLLVSFRLSTITINSKATRSSIFNDASRPLTGTVVAKSHHSNLLRPTLEVFEYLSRPQRCW